MPIISKFLFVIHIGDNYEPTNALRKCKDFQTELGSRYKMVTVPTDRIALAGAAQLGHCPMRQKSAGLTPGQGTCLG